MTERLQARVFASGSTTYFNSSAFFSKEVKRDVESLYGFVRVADNYVDALPQDIAGFNRFATGWRRAVASGQEAGPAGTWQQGLTPNEAQIIGDYLELSQRRQFNPTWTEAFLAAMEADLHKRIYSTEAETLAYVYGSAEVIGLFMARLLDLSPEATHSARMLGRAMQYINFIRDVAEDSGFGRRYLPVQPFSYPQDWLPNQAEAEADPKLWADFINSHLERYRQWQAEAVQGYHFIPRRPRSAIKTAGDMYDWTGRVIAADPLIVFRQKVKPSKGRIVRRAVFNLLFC